MSARRRCVDCPPCRTERPLSLAALRGKVILPDFFRTCGRLNSLHIIHDLKQVSITPSLKTSLHNWLRTTDKDPILQFNVIVPRSSFPVSCSSV